jgi:ubiquitin conjugation factor E4 B
MQKAEESSPARGEEREKMVQTARALRTAATLAGQALKLLEILASTVSLQSEPVLVRVELCNRLADSVNTYLHRLAGPKRDLIRVQSSVSSNGPGASGSNVANSSLDQIYRPDQWIASLLSVLLHLSDRREFRLALVKEDHGYNYSTLLNARSFVSDMPLEQLEKLDFLLEDLNQLHSETHEEYDSADGDIPSEFCDPLIDTVMEDPVILPSGMTVERSVILRHLANKRVDPFTRKPLEPSQLVPNDDLKRRIQRWKEEQRRKKQNAATANIINNENVNETGAGSTGTGIDIDLHGQRQEGEMEFNE